LETTNSIVMKKKAGESAASMNRRKRNCQAAEERGNPMVFLVFRRESNERMCAKRKAASRRPLLFLMAGAES